MGKFIIKYIEDRDDHFNKWKIFEHKLRALCLEYDAECKESYEEE